MYAKILKNMIADANITQEELSKKCSEMGTPITRNQINRILNRKANAPEENISRSIAKICNADERELVLAGYLEKAPHEFIEYLNKEQDLSLEMGLAFLGEKLSNEQKEVVKELYRKETLVELIIKTLDIKDIPKMPQNLFDVKIDDDKINTIYNELMFFIMKDDSMQDKIPKGSKLRLESKDKYENGDIVVLEVNGEKIIRMIIWIGRTIFAYPLNKNYQVQMLNNGEYKIIAKIRSVEIPI